MSLNSTWQGQKIRKTTKSIRKSSLTNRKLNETSVEELGNFGVVTESSIIWYRITIWHLEVWTRLRCWISNGDWKFPESDGRWAKREARDGCNVELWSRDIHNVITKIWTPPNDISGVEYSIRPLWLAQEGNKGVAIGAEPMIIPEILSIGP